MQIHPRERALAWSATSCWLASQIPEAMDPSSRLFLLMAAFFCAWAAVGVVAIEHSRRSPQGER